jgi:histidine decarboxylase
MSKLLTVVLIETEGALARVTTVLAEGDINLIDIDAEEIENIGVVKIEVSDEQFDLAFELLRDSGHQVMPLEVVLAKLEDKPGALAKLAVRLADAKVNVRSMRIVRREEGYCLAAIVPEPVDLAKAILADKVIAG